MALYSYGSSSKSRPTPQGKTEFELLKDAHKFLRDEEDDGNDRWEEQMASKYYSSLYREFAVCDLKHYKSGNFALRWRTEDEVLSGAGESTCGNTRCKHEHSRRSEGKKAALTTLELPFAYVERGESKTALVKVILCDKCFDKLMWKRRQGKESSKSGPEADSEGAAVKQEELDPVLGTIREDQRAGSSSRGDDHKSRGARMDRWDRERDLDWEKLVPKKRSSRSLSPRAHKARHRSKRRPS